MRPTRRSLAAVVGITVTLTVVLGWVYTPKKHVHEQANCGGATKARGVGVGPGDCGETFGWSWADRHCLEMRLSTREGGETPGQRNEYSDAAIPARSTAGHDGKNLEAATAWCALADVSSMRGRCSTPPCQKGKHRHNDIADFGQEMAQIEGAVVLQRPDIVDAGSIWPATDLDFAKTMQAYFTVFKESLFARGMLEPNVRSLWNIPGTGRFLDAIIEGDDEAGVYLSPYYSLPEVEISQAASCGFETTPTVVSMADVYISTQGYVFNEKDYVVPKSCKTEKFSHTSVPKPASRSRYAQVLVLAQHWSDKYFHFFTECLPRITLMLDVLQAYPDIWIAVGYRSEDERDIVEQLVQLLGLNPDRLIFNKEIHADLAFLPDSTACGQPNTVMISLLRSALLRGLFPTTGGVPPSTPKPVILLIVRMAKRGLSNNDEIREALKTQFPSHDVVEFVGEGSMRDQLELFAKASLIVGPHGAGFANIIVSPLHTMVLEIGPPGCPSCYVHLAVKLQHIFARHLGGVPWDQECNSEFSPDVDEIMAMSRDLLEAKGMADAADPPQRVPARGIVAPALSLARPVSDDMTRRRLPEGSDIANDSGSLPSHGFCSATG